MIPFTHDSGVVIAGLDSHEAALIRTLALQFAELASHEASGKGSPLFSRLIPDAYPDNTAASAEFRRFTAERLIESKRGYANSMRETVSAASIDSAGTHWIRLSMDQAEEWLRALTDLRMILATRLKIVNDGDRSHDDSYEQAVYDWLAALQESLVQALNSSEELPSSSPYDF